MPPIEVPFHACIFWTRYRLLPCKDARICWAVGGIRLRHAPKQQHLRSSFKSRCVENGKLREAYEEQEQQNPVSWDEPHLRKEICWIPVWQERSGLECWYQGNPCSQLYQPIPLTPPGQSSIDWRRRRRRRQKRRRRRTKNKNKKKKKKKKKEEEEEEEEQEKEQEEEQDKDEEKEEKKKTQRGRKKKTKKKTTKKTKKKTKRKTKKKKKKQTKEKG